MSEIAAPRAPAARGRWLWIALVGSLAFNALLVGVIARSLWQVRANLAMTGSGIETSLPAFVKTLPAERREVVGGAAGQDKPGALRPLRMEVRRARAEAIRQFLAEPFDKQAFIAAQGRLLEAETKLRMSMQRLLPELGERMTAAERRAYLNWRAHAWGYRRGPGNAQRGGIDPERGDEPGAGVRRP